MKYLISIIILLQLIMLGGCGGGNNNSNNLPHVQPITTPPLDNDPIISGNPGSGNKIFSIRFDRSAPSGEPVYRFSPVVNNQPETNNSEQEDNALAFINVNGEGIIPSEEGLGRVSFNGTNGSGSITLRTEPSDDEPAGDSGEPNGRDVPYPVDYFRNVESSNIALFEEKI